MESSFWHKRWESNQIGFHQKRVNPYLQAHWAGLALPAECRVLVPLCGKSQDLAWLAGQGHRVLGVELSRRAVEDFFLEHGLEPKVTQQGAFEVWESGDVQLWCGDFFALQPDDVAQCVGFYDRAALIALPPAMRQRYMAFLSTLLPARCAGLLVTLEYDQSRIDGPPFAVFDDEVRAGFAQWQSTQLEAPEVLEKSPKFQAVGVPSLVERVYRLQR